MFVITNNSTKTRKEYMKKLAGFGFDVEEVYLLLNSEYKKNIVEICHFTCCCSGRLFEETWV